MPRTLVRGFFVCRPAPAEGQPRPGAAGARRGAAQPAGPRRLAGVLREALKADRLDPFYGVLMDQSGRVVYGDDAPMPADRILSMNWLLTSVEGRIPQFEEFTEKAQELIKLQGVERQSEP